MYPWFKLSLQNIGLADLAGPQISVFLALASASTTEGLACMSYAQISKLTGFARRTCINAVGNLCKRGLIRRVSSPNPLAPLTVEILSHASVGPGAPRVPGNGHDDDTQEED